MIKNPIYTGKIKWDGRVYSGTHPAIIDEKIFDEAQNILAKRREHLSLRRSNSSNYLLSGLLKCEKCKRYMVEASGRSNVYYYYSCLAKIKCGECQMESLPKEKIEKAILSQLKSILKDDSFLHLRGFSPNVLRIEEVAEGNLWKSLISLLSAVRRRFRFLSISYLFANCSTYTSSIK